jgi:hypothetical protein
MTPATVEFAYDALPAAEQRWLKEKVGAIRLLTRAAAESVLTAGKHLAEVRQRFKQHGLFKAWVATEFAFCPATAYKWIAVYERLGGRLGDRHLPIDSTALYALADRRTSPDVVDRCVTLAEGGTRVTPALVRSLTVRDKPERNPARDREYEARRKADDRSTRRTADATADPAAVMAAFIKLVETAEVVTFRRIDDTEEDRSFHQSGGRGDLDRGALIPYAVTVHDKAGTRTTIDPDSWEVLLLKAAGMEPKRRCDGPCKQYKGLYTGFSRKKNNVEGRCPRCKACEQERVRVAKRKIEERKRERRDGLLEGFDPDAWRTKQR